MSAPALVLVAHGTRSARGVEMIAELAGAVRRELNAVAFARAAGTQTGAGADFGAASASLRELAVAVDAGTAIGSAGASVVAAPRVRTAFVDVLGPSPAEVLRDLDSIPAVVVPAFLASGYHVYQDVPREVAASAHGAVAVTQAMGPDPALAEVMALRLRAAGWRPGDAVVFAAAGSSDSRARQDVQRAANLLSDRIGLPAHLAYIATGEPRVPEVVAAVRASGARRVFIASYLLAHGLFHQRLHEAGADGVAEPIGVHPSVVRLLTDRYYTAIESLSTVRVA
ncbi:CbiX/SirB N-terminal domain-containing protein [Nocardia sp. CDC153]|uniref:sirohydrochlorin chelatase n=1 Tax=Nocardia sp. CDC153 TaxID=3112167 RepID=UPI002DBC929F|nr:CbiX/SirB N-terminal domain-containing protein [Nocardia sp. CDC153]MEC3952332.1 CbiX/SirB N-terminal domain-containing protein [Nocardia sp. CDC153]